MRINDNFSQRIIVHGESMDWIDSPIKGVMRRPLDRIGGEVARATSFVRYEPGSRFSPHVHTGGEEFIVLEGVFQDEHGDFPAGSYIRNPPQSSHTPGSEPGCVIFVKLWQFDLEDRTHVTLRMDAMKPVTLGNGVAITPLFQDTKEEVSLFTLEPGADLNIDAGGGAELLVLDGSIKESGDELVRHSWMRLPVGSNIAAKAADAGAKLWVKTGHMSEVEAQIERVSKVA